MVARTDTQGQAVHYNTTGLSIQGLAVTGGINYIFVLDGTMGDPYGDFRGQSGIR